MSMTTTARRGYQHVAIIIGKRHPSIRIHHHNIIRSSGVLPSRDFILAPTRTAQFSTEGSAPAVDRDRSSAEFPAQAAVPPPTLSIDKEAVELSKDQETKKKEDTFEFEPGQVVADLIKASKWNQGVDVDDEDDPNGTIRRWKYIRTRKNKQKASWDKEFVRKTVASYKKHLEHISSLLHDGKELPPDAQLLYNSDTVGKAMRCVLKMQVHTPTLSGRVRDLERLVGSIGRTPLTDELSLRLLEANGKTGNVGRTLALLELRKVRNYPPKQEEFWNAITAIHSAGLTMLMERNAFHPDDWAPEIDNPTRWLDGILLNMHERGFQLTHHIINHMLGTYACTGRTGRSLHHFYKIVRRPVPNKDSTPHLAKHQNHESEQPVRVRMVRSKPPHFTKIPSQVRDTKFNMESKLKFVDFAVKLERRTRLEWESRADYSLPLSAAMSFADSLTHGACGHEPIQLNLVNWNTLISVCCHRGALWRAMDLLERVIPQHGLKPDYVSYNTLLDGLARVGDTVMMNEFLVTMTNKGVSVTTRTARAMVDGYLEVADIPGANTAVQDIFNQHAVLPPFLTLIKIIEFALANELIFEAKRQVYFIQQLRKWKPSPSSDPQLIRNMAKFQKDRRFQKESLQRIFQYFGFELREEDFF